MRGDHVISTRRWLRGIFVTLVSLSAGCAQPTLPARTPPPAEEPPPRIEVQEFVLGPRDEVEVFVWQHADLSRTAVVSPGGLLSYPLVGTIKASGLSGEALATQIHESLARYIVDPQVTVTVKSVRSQKVFVLGEVNRPGVFPLDGPVRAVEAIALAGGFTQDAETKSVLLIRGNLSQPELYTLALDRTLFQGAPGENVRLQPGDVVYVPAMPIADVERFFKRITNILIPIIAPVQTFIFLGRPGG
jgi:polysaccharide export outer membrane protein